MNAEPLTVDDLARARGLDKPHHYDTALPVDWCDDFRAYTSVWPAGLFVWCYRPACGRSLFGHPHPLTHRADALLQTFEAPR